MPPLCGHLAAVLNAFQTYIDAVVALIVLFSLVPKKRTFFFFLSFLMHINIL